MTKLRMTELNFFNSQFYYIIASYFYFSKVFLGYLLDFMDQKVLLKYNPSRYIG